jgi:chromate transporter
MSFQFVYLISFAQFEDRISAYYTSFPAFFFILIGAPWVERTKENVRLKDVLSIITAAVVGVILNLTIYFSKAVLFSHGLRQPEWLALIWTILSLFALYRLKVNMILWIVISGALGLLYTLFHA